MFARSVRRRAFTWLLGLFIVLMIPRPASAQASLYLDRASWDAAAASARLDTTQITFEGIAAPGETARFFSLTLADVTFTPTVFMLLVPDPGVGLFISAWGTGAMLEGLGTIRATLPPGTRAVGTSYGVTCVFFLPGCGSSPWRIGLSTGEVITIPGLASTTTMPFAGVVSSVDIAWMEVSPDGSFTLLDNFTIGVFNVLQVDVDVKPDDEVNSLTPNNHGVIPVTILGSPAFDATTVDSNTVRLGPTGSEASVASAALEDVNGDGLIDLMLHFRTEHLAIACGQTELLLTGSTLDGHNIAGSDSIKTVGCK
jgi:hypothetical protein